MKRVAVVTGAGGSMGAACSAALADTFDTLLLTDRDADAVQRTARALGDRCDIVVGDIAAPGFADDLAARAADLGAVHALVHTAGLSPTMAAWPEILAVDLVATARLVQAFETVIAPGGVAVCLASVSAHMGTFDARVDRVLDDPLAPDITERFAAAHDDEPDPGNTYRLAKRGVVRLCERAAPAWGRRGARIVSVSPGLVDTTMGRRELEHQPIKTWLAEITPVGGGRNPDTVLPGLVDDIAATVAFLCSDAAAFVSGCDIRVDGGLLAALHEAVPTDNEESS